MNKNQALVIARKVRADVYLKHQLSFTLPYLKSQIKFFTSCIGVYLKKFKYKEDQIFNAYKSFCENDLNGEHAVYAICAWVEMENAQEERDILDAVNNSSQK